MSRRAIFLDRDGVINVEKNFVLSPDEIELYPFSGGAIKKLNQAGYLVIVITNQSAVARNYISLDDLERIHRAMRHLLSSSAGARVDDIYYCPHREHLDEPPDNPEFIKDCDCRKPKPGMLLEAARRWDIDLESSWLIGDSARDIQAGKDAGCRTIGLRTGHALKGIVEPPDYIFDDLDEAVDFIMNGS